MIHVFNRKELAITFDMKKQTAIRDKLSACGIDYTVKAVNRTSPSSIPVRGGTRTYTGSLGTGVDKAYEYIIYVRKEDYEKARAVLCKVL